MVLLLALVVMVLVVIVWRFGVGADIVSCHEQACTGGEQNSTRGVEEIVTESAI